MPDKLTPMSGTAADKVLTKQTYAIDTVAQNMFAEPVQKGRKQLVPPTTLKGVTIQQLWDHVFADNTDFLKRYHDKRGELNLDVGAWHYAPDKGSGYRFVSLTTIVEVPRAGTKTQLNEAHRFAYVTAEGGKQLLAYQISSQTPNVMSGSSFRVDSYCEITADSPEASCTVAFWGQCKKMGSFMIVPLSVIEPRAMREMTAGYKVMVEMMQKDLGGSGGEEPAANTGAAAAATPPAAAATTTTTTTTVAPAETPRTAEVVVAAEPAVAESPSSGLFQGMLMVLALLVALFVIWSSVTVRRTAVDAARIRAAMRGVDGCGSAGCYAHHVMHGGRGACDGGCGGGSGGSGVGARSSIASTLDADGSPTMSAAAAAAAALLEADVMSEEQALYKAAQDAQINTLRYRWLEQRDAITALEGNVWWMQCAIVLLLIVSFTLSMRVFFC